MMIYLLDLVSEITPQVPRCQSVCVDYEFAYNIIRTNQYGDTNNEIISKYQRNGHQPKGKKIGGITPIRTHLPLQKCHLV